MDLIIANDTPRIDSAIAATEKIVSDLCEINKNTVSKTEFEKLQRKYIRLEIQYEMLDPHKNSIPIVGNSTSEASVSETDLAKELIKNVQSLGRDLYHIKENTISKSKYEEIEKSFAGVKLQNVTFESSKTDVNRADKEKTLELEWRTSSENNLLQRKLKHAEEKNSSLEAEITNLQEGNRVLEKLLHERDKDINRGHVETLRLKLETEKLESKIVKELNEKFLIDKELKVLTDMNNRLMKKNEKLESDVHEKLSEIAQLKKGIEKLNEDLANAVKSVETNRNDIHPHSPAMSHRSNSSADENLDNSVFDDPIQNGQPSFLSSPIRDEEFPSSLPDLSHDDFIEPIKEPAKRRNIQIQPRQKRRRDHPAEMPSIDGDDMQSEYACSLVILDDDIPQRSKDRRKIRKSERIHAMKYQLRKVQERQGLEWYCFECLVDLYCDRNRLPIYNNVITKGMIPRFKTVAELRDHKRSHEDHEDGRASLVCTEKNCAMELYTNRKNTEMENSMQALGTELNGHKAWKHRSDLISVPKCSKKIGNSKCGIVICDNNYAYNQRAREQHDIYYHIDIDNTPNHEIYRKITRFEDEDHGGWKRSIQTDYDFF